VAHHGGGRDVSPLAPITVDVDDVVAAIGAHRYGYTGEGELQEGLAAVLTLTGLPVRREVHLDARDRIDILTGRVGIEVKVAGQSDRVLSQLRRYADSPLLDQLVLVTTCARHRDFPARVGGKPLTVVRIGGVG